MSTLFQDFRYALRVLIKSPGFAIIAILTLALGIGANSTIFSWINSTVLNPIPGVKNTTQLAELAAGKENDPTPLSYLDYVDLRDHNKTMSGLMAFSMWPMDLTGKQKPQRVWGVFATANYFDTLSVRPILGRTFLPVEGTKPGGAPVVVLSYHLWVKRFGSDRNIIDKTIEINKHPFTVIGVAPPLFVGTQTSVRADLWFPAMMADDFAIGGAKILQERGTNWLMAIGRLKPGTTRAQAQEDLAGLYAHLAQQYPDSHRALQTATLYPMWHAPWGANFYLSVILYLLMAIAGVVLLLACVNVANLMLVRSVARRREMAIRLSIGASRWRLIRQLLVESILLALCGGGIAMLLTLWTTPMLGGFVPPTEIPIVMDYHADSTVLYVTLAISVLTGVIFGILPALRSSGLRPIAVLKEESGSMSGGRNKARLSSSLVVAQIAMSLLLLICAGLFIRSFHQQQKFYPGFNPQGVLIENYDLQGVGYTQQQGLEFHRELLAKLDAIPGVKSAALATFLPMSMVNGSSTAEAEGYVPQPHENMSMFVDYVTPDYLRTMEIPLIAGRSFAMADTDKTQLVAIVDREFVRRYWQGQYAIGKRLRVDGKWFTVVGEMENYDTDHLGEKPKPVVFIPLLQDYSPQVSIHVRVAGNPLAYVAAVGSAVHSLDADLPLYDLMTLQSRVDLNSTTSRIGGAFVGAFGILALVLAAIGVYGVLAYTMRQRTHEFGIRMALGAEPRDVFKLVLRQGAALALLGIAIGLVASFLLTRGLSSQLFGVSPSDPLTFAAVSLLLLLVALLACYVPARRAMRTDPMTALRYE